MTMKRMTADDLLDVAVRVAGVHPTYSHNVRTGGKIEFIRDQGPVRRDIRAPDFKWSPESLRDLAKILWAAQRAQSYGMSAYRIFSKMPSSSFSPDGLLGGRGYIQAIKDMRTAISTAVETLSSFTDTIHDEINAPHWALNSEPMAAELVQDAAQVKADPEGFIADEVHEVRNPDPGAMNPTMGEEEGEKDGEEGEEESESQQTRVSARKKSARPGSQLPQDDSPQKETKSEAELEMHTTSPDHGAYAASIARILAGHKRKYAGSPACASCGACSGWCRGRDMGRGICRSCGSGFFAANGTTAAWPEGQGPGEIRRADSLPQDLTRHPVMNRDGLPFGSGAVPPAGGNEAGHFNHDAVWPSDDPSGEGFTSVGPVYEDEAADGVTGYDNPTDGDESVLLAVSRVALGPSTYSWLPGADNQKIMNYYDPGATEADIEWMRAHSDPDPPPGTVVTPPKPWPDPLWEGRR